MLQLFPRTAVEIAKCWSYRRAAVSHTFSRMGSSNCKSFSPNKVAGASAHSHKHNGSDKMTANPDYVEGIVCKDTDVKENEMKTFDLGESGKVLLVRQGGVLSAIGTKCTHYGAPLATGALGEGRVRCPWHGACFNIKTGDIEDFPGLNSLPCYQVTVQSDGQVKVRAKKTELESNHRIKTMMKRNPLDRTTYMVIGGGPSAAACVETLRQNSCSGRIIMIAKENALPYDRVKISKALNSDVKKLQLRDDEFYRKNEIEVLKGTEVVKVDCSNKTVSLDNGNSLNFSSLYIATGSKSRRLSMPGSDLVNVFTLRTFTDGAEIHEAIGPDVDKHVVILGVGFIGMEAAAYCVGKAKSITVIGRDDVPFRPIFGDEIGASIMKLFVDKGVEFKTNTNIKSCIGEGGRIVSVQLNDDSIIPADVLIMGVGSTFNTEFLKDSGITLDSDGSVPITDKMETNIDGIYAGGDIAKAPVYSHNDKMATIGHYGLAHYHGRIAAYNMLNIKSPLKAVPFFWTMLFGKSIRYCGHGRFSDIKIDGNVEELNFVAFYSDENGKIISMASCQRDPIVAQFAEYLAQGRALFMNDLRNDPFAWVKNVARS